VEQDSLYKQALQNKMLDIETKYQTEKKEKENLQLKADKEVQAGQMKLLGGGIGALLLSLGIFTFYYRRNKKQKDKIEALQKELHHRIDNNLAIIDGFIDKSMEGVEDKAVLENLGELQSRVGSINEVHRLLYQDNDVTALNLNKYMHALASHVQNIYKRDQVKINISCAENLVIDTNKSVHFGLIVNEFLTNSYKYAFAGVQHPIIDLVIEQNAKGISLNIKDNGIGFEADSIHKNAYGTRIMELLANKLHASYSLSGNDGTVLHLQLNTA
jgi:two-component sensor histidine kinase